MTRESVVTAEGLTKSYHVGGRHVHALVDASFTLFAGEMVVVRGRSGSGKSTLLTILGLLARPDAGALRLGDRDVLGLDGPAEADVRGNEIGFVFQSFHLLQHLSALENVTLAVRRPEKVARVVAEELLVGAGLGDRMKHRPTQLSGGEQQRVALVRALSNNPTLVLADEPTGNLDADSESIVLDRLRAASRDGRTVLIASHSEAACERADRVLTMERGAIRE